MRPTPQNRLRAAGCISEHFKTFIAWARRLSPASRRHAAYTRELLAYEDAYHARYEKPEHEAQRLRDLGGRPRSPEEEREFQDILRCHRHFSKYYFEGRVWEWMRCRAARAREAALKIQAGGSGNPPEN